MKYLFLFFSLVYACSSNAQNIVPNSNFAIVSSCPTLVGEITKSVGWYQPTYGSSDYFNGCGATVSSIVSVPTNLLGTQTNHANAYAGVCTYDEGDGGINYREYIARDIPALVPGHKYRVSIRVSLADKSKYATNGLGVYFYIVAKPNGTTESVIPVTPQVDYTTSGQITDKTSWTGLFRTFIADSAYTHLVVGCFLSNAVQNRSLVGGSDELAYYYIDSVAVESLGPTRVENIPERRETILYPNPSLGYSKLTFHNPLHEPHCLFIFDMHGRMVERIENVIDEVVTIQSKKFGTGFYYYQLFNPAQMVGCGTMMID
ncbi:MAG: hypothetical protein K0Q79_1247 [Flavipsychrobacter sp.]|jgi:hypothetical protein|nr:hypothetical protein [Flavipsychrobacter sp.]